MDFTKFNTAKAQQAVSYNEGLREYMLSVYKYMAMALSITGLVAMFVSSTPALMQAIFGTPLYWVVALAPIGMVFFMSSKVMSMSVSGAKIAFWVFAGLMGLSMSSLFIVYTGMSIARVFFITASLFGVMSLYGYTTKKDLSGLGSFLMMGLVGIVLASLVNIFLGSPMMHFVISVIGVLVFVGLTAYDTQRIKMTYNHVAQSGELASKMAIYGALSLYMDFINLFMFMLQFFGRQKIN